MSISAAGSAAGVTDVGLVARLGAAQLTDGVPVIIAGPPAAGVAFVVTNIDVFSDGTATGDVNVQVVIGGTSIWFWNDTFGAATEGSRHYRGLFVLRPGESLEMSSFINGSAVVCGYVVPYHAGVAYGL